MRKGKRKGKILGKLRAVFGTRSELEKILDGFEDVGVV